MAENIFKMSDYLVNKQSIKKGYLHSLAYSSPIIGYMILVAPMAVLGGIYAKYFGLSFATISIAMLIAKIFDAITDPIIGICSDFLKSRTGSRKPMILTGGVLLIISSWFLYVPVLPIGFSYFILCYLFFYAAFTLFLIPYMAWVNEFTADTQEKTLAISCYSVAGQIGHGLFYLLPLFPYFSSNDITPEVLRFCVIIGGVIFLLGLVIAIMFVPDGITLNSEKKSSSRIDKSLVRNIVNAVLSNRPFLIYSGILIFHAIAFGMYSGIFFIFVDTYLQLGHIFAQLTLWGSVVAGISVIFWYRMIIYLGKRLMLLIVYGVLLCVYMMMGMLEKGEVSFSILLGLNLISLVAGVAGGIINASLLCDIIDYDQLKNATIRSGLFFSMQNLISKFFGAIGSAVALAIISWFGYESVSLAHNESSIMSIRYALSWIPSFFLFIAILFICRISIDERRVNIIRRRLALRS
jgi:glycoside/pentoside/hexuronide:cation symporter, GPH family